MKLRKKVAAIVLAGAIIAGHSIAVLAALSGFTVSTPSLVTLNGKYVASGGVSYKPTSGSGTWYLQDKVQTYKKNGNGEILLDSGVGFGWNAASAMTDGTSTKPTKILNIGSYKSGTSYTEVGREQITVK